MAAGDLDHKICHYSSTQFGSVVSEQSRERLYPNHVRGAATGTIRARRRPAVACYVLFVKVHCFANQYVIDKRYLCKV